MNQVCELFGPFCRSTLTYHPMLHVHIVFCVATMVSIHVLSSFQKPTLYGEILDAYIQLVVELLLHA
jgi:hypothetical protein